MLLVSIPEVLQLVTNISHIELDLPDNSHMFLFVDEV